MKVVNLATREIEDINDDAAPDLINSGSHSLLKGETVNVFKDGQSFSLPTEQIQDALAQGYTLETSTQKAVRNYVEENQGITGAAKVALGKFASEAALGLPELVYEKTQDPLEVAKWEALKKEHNTASMLGSVAGFGASFVAPGVAPAMKLATKAGEVAIEKAGIKAIADRLVAQGMERGSVSAAKGIVGKLIEGGSKGIVEGVLQSAPRAVTEEALGDTEQAAESLLAGGLTGLVFGGTAGALSGVYNQVKKGSRNLLVPPEPEADLTRGIIKTPSNIPETAITETIPERSQPIPSSISDAASSLGADSKMQNLLSSELTKVKPNAKNIEEAHQLLSDALEIPVPVLESTISDSKAIRNIDSVLMNSPTKIGQERFARYQITKNAARSGLEKSLGTISNDSAETLGDKIRNELFEIVSKDTEEVSALYDEFNDMFQAVPVNQAGVKKVAQNLLKDNFVTKTPSSATASMFRRVAEELPLQTTLKDLKEYRTNLWHDFRDAARSNPALQRGLAVVDEKLVNMEERYIKQTAAQMKNPEAKAKVLNLIDQHANAKARYADLMGKLEVLSGMTSTGKIKTPGQFLDRLGEKQAAKLAKGFFDKEDAQALDVLKSFSPKIYSEVIKAKRGELLRQSTSKDVLNHSKLAETISKMSPEIQAHIVDNPELFSAARLVDNNLISNINPSGTDISKGIRERITDLSVGGLLANITRGIKDDLASRAQRAIVEGVQNKSGVLAAEAAQKNTANKLSRIENIIETLETKGHKARPAVLNAAYRVIDHPDYYSEVMKRVGEMNATPTESSPMLETTNPFYQQGAPMVAGHMVSKAQNAIAYLANEIPDSFKNYQDAKNGKPKISDFEMAKWKRKVDTVADPFSVIDKLENGSLTRDEVQTLKTVYPKIHEAIIKRVVDTLASRGSTLSFQSALKLGTLLDADLDAVGGKAYKYQKTRKPAEANPTNIRLNVSKRFDLKEG